MGIPDAPDWRAVTKGATQAVQKAAESLKFSKNEQVHRRGCFRVKGFGVSMGGGQTKPMTLKHSKETQKILRIFRHNRFIKRINGFVNSMYRAYSVRNYVAHKSNVAELRAWNPNLRFNFIKSVFTSMTVNFGPRTISFRHNDRNNRRQSWCAITAGGKFNANKSGYLILWDLRLAVRFPAGSSIAIPSAICSHSNTRIQQGETRYSMTQYSAGGLFRFIANGNMTDKAWEATASAASLRARELDRQQRWKQALQYFTTLDELGG